jgi:hypothetical protein
MNFRAYNERRRTSWKSIITDDEKYNSDLNVTNILVRSYLDCKNIWLVVRELSSRGILCEILRLSLDRFVRLPRCM